MKILNCRVTALALAALGASSAALAQNVTIYGVLDVGVEYMNHVGAASSSNWRMPANTNTTPSRLGLRGSEDLGGGYSATFTIESGMAPGTGVLNQGGRMWGRQAFVGLTGPYGTVSLGRQYTMTFWSGLDADTHGGGIYGTGSLDSYLPNARADNAIAWRGTFSGVSLGATYSLGRDSVNAGPSPAGTNCPQVSGDSKACREWSLMVKYDTKTWGVAVANDQLTGRNVGAAPDAVFGGLTTNQRQDNRLIINGWFKLGEAKIGGGVIRRDNDGNPARPKSDLWHVGVTHPVTPLFQLSAQVAALRYDNAGAFDSTLLSVRGTYLLSKRSAVFVQAGHIDNKASAAVSVSGGAAGSTPAAGNSQTGFNVGVRHAF